MKFLTPQLEYLRTHGETRRNLTVLLRYMGVVAATVLAACAIQWLGWLIPGNYGHFLFWSGVLLVAIAVILAIPIEGDRRRLRSKAA